MSTPPPAEYLYLCLACGGIADACDFEAMERGDDPPIRCPNCGHVHVDDDANPGFVDLKERA